MKNISLLILIFSILFLASCGKQEHIENKANTNSGKNIVRTGTENKELTNTGNIKEEAINTNSGKNIVRTGTEIKTVNKEITNTGNIKEEAINTNSGKNIVRTGTEIKTVNKEITNTGNIKEEAIKEVKKIRTITIENFNVVLKEEGKTINKLTTKATSQKECNWEAGDEGTKNLYIYKIVATNKNYGIVKKEEIPCGGQYTGITYFGIDLKNNTELTEIGTIPFEVKEKLENNILKFLILEPQFIVENAVDRGDIGVEDVKNEGFKKEGSDWVKTIDLKNIIKK